jgi:hypothetical protein
VLIEGVKNEQLAHPGQFAEIYPIGYRPMSSSPSMSSGSEKLMGNMSSVSTFSSQSASIRGTPQTERGMCLLKEYRLNS